MICAGRSFGTGKFVVPPSGGAEPGKFVVPPLGGEPGKFVVRP